MMGSYLTPATTGPVDSITDGQRHPSRERDQARRKRRADRSAASRSVNRPQISARRNSIRRGGADDLTVTQTRDGALSRLNGHLQHVDKVDGLDITDTMEADDGQCIA
jgi:hypothetical protein